MRVRIDPDRHQGHARCHALAPDGFDADEHGHSSVHGHGHVRPGRQAVARLAIATCPG